MLTKEQTLKKFPSMSHAEYNLLKKKEKQERFSGKFKGHVRKLESAFHNGCFRKKVELQVDSSLSKAMNREGDNTPIIVKSDEHIYRRFSKDSSERQQFNSITEIINKINWRQRFKE